MPQKKNPLNIAFLWHYHQPFYKNASGFYHMPWIRFHGTKDYRDMLLLFEAYPELRHTINLVPSLVRQLQDYSEHHARDNIWLLSSRSAETLTRDEQHNILENFFLANVDTMIRPYPRYFELYEKYEYQSPYESLREQVERFDTQDYRDLQVWYNLIWIGQESRREEPFQMLFEKGRDFSETDKQLLFKETEKVLGDIIPRHRKMWEEGNIELVTSPFYHPILPLLIDSDIAAVASPDNPYPKPPYRHPEDAEAQLKRGLDFFEDVFGRRPEGIWPPEGGVSTATADLIARTRVRWTAADENILSQSLKRKFDSHQIYQPHLFHGKSRSIHMFFRDQQLSKAIAHVYSSWDAEKAADDFISHLRNIRQRLMKKYSAKALREHIVPIIIDGETCWEKYPNNGRDFLHALFSRLAKAEMFQTTTFGQFLETERETPNLYELYPGSWINNNFDIWIGSEEDNRAWTLLKNTRDFLVKQENRGVLSNEVSEEAWRQIYIAQDSEWCWWYGDEHSSVQDVEFDQLFREHLMKVYELANGEIPAALYQTIKQTHFDRFASIRPQNFIYPTMDGEQTHFYEWTGAAVYEGRKSPQTAMHRISRIIDKFHLGFDEKQFYFRIDFARQPDLLYEFVIAAKTPRQVTLVYSPLRGVLEKFESHALPVKKILLTPTFRVRQIFEGAITFESLGLKPGDLFGFQLIIKQNGQSVETFPHTKIIEVEVPDEDYETREWLV